MNDQALNSALDHFSQELVPSEDFLKTGNETVDYIFRLLQSSKKYSVDRCKIAGSIGKSTAVCVMPDIDLVVFVNNEHPFFKDVLDNFEDILNTANMDIKVNKANKYSIQFTANNIEFDLLPAANLVKVVPSPDKVEAGRLQAEAVLKLVQSNPAVGYRYGSSVCEKTLEFIAGQTPFVHGVIRLAKFWNKTLHLGDVYISGRSSLIELIAVHAGRMVEMTGNRSYFKAFEAFLTLMASFDMLEIIFCEKYMQFQIPEDVKRQRPLVLDPVNPYNNFAYKLSRKPEILHKFKTFASETLRRLYRGEDLNVLFAVQPKVILSGPQPPKWLLGTRDITLINPTMKVNPRISDRDFKQREFGVKQMRTCLLTTMAALTLGGKKIEVEEVKKRVQRIVDINILGLDAPREWTETTTKFEDYDFTLHVPIPGYENRCIVLAGSW